MKNIFSFILLLIILIGCGTSQNNTNGSQQGDADGEKEHSTMSGYVAKVEDNRILLIENKPTEQLSEIDPENLYEEAGNAIYFNIEEIKESMVSSLIIGEKVAIEHGAVNESYPGQSTATKISRLVDENYDVIAKHTEFNNTYLIDLFFEQKYDILRTVQYTTEGDPIFTMVKREGANSYFVSVDASQDNFGASESPTLLTCTSIESYSEENDMNFMLVGCDGEQNEIALLSAPVEEIIVPNQTYSKVTINANEEVIYESENEDEIAEIIDKIKSGKKQSVIAMSLMKPDGKLVLHGDKTEVSFDYYLTGALIRHNLYIEAGITPNE
ncbi:DUF3221 domain-containing protein [Saliterribacillus persicus]|uniref:Uncharacterized protein DUF4362 n=1 Tax=Saliterribacillus persicus TaxID=930114 RepID=A0A368XPM9_9BACI|nr:DUF3221 domain-containing protein [Saliterribacillus persicus]RCW69815.1 uncharacterized protein DUF4362 [Saliterribacillus persicus]